MPEGAAVLEIRDLCCTLGGRAVLRGVSLAVGAGETVVLLGRSGSGKTTLLKAINGLVTPTSGEMRFEGKAAAEWDPIRMRRRMGYVIQEAGLFPHWTVAENIGLVPRLEQWPEERIAKRVEELLEAVSLARGGIWRALSAPAFGRRAAARGHRAGAGGGSAAAAAGRAVRGARPDYAAGVAAAISGAAPAAAAGRAVRDARCARGADAGNAHRAAAGGRARGAAAAGGISARAQPEARAFLAAGAGWRSEHRLARRSGFAGAPGTGSGGDRGGFGHRAAGGGGADAAGRHAGGRWASPTSRRPFPAWRCSGFCCRCRWWAASASAPPSWRCACMRCCRFCAIR